MFTLLQLRSGLFNTNFKFNILRDGKIKNRNGFSLGFFALLRNGTQCSGRPLSKINTHYEQKEKS